MKLVTAEEMRSLDEEAIKKIGIPSIVLMENAGLKTAQIIEKEYSPLKGKSVYIFCGPGNNGGDGMVVARHLFNQGIKVKIFLLGKKEKLKKDAARNLAITEKMGISIKEITSSEDIESLKKELTPSPFPLPYGERIKVRGKRKFLYYELKEVEVVVDALLGTGSKGAPRGLMKEAITLINKYSKNILALDIPTGVDADTGEVAGEAVKADHTITFAYPKRGLYLYPGMDYAGKIKVVDIGIPSTLEEKRIKSNLLTSSDVSKDLFYRKLSSHKGSFGHLLVIAGSEGMTGAASLSALAALRVGAGLVTLGIPESLNPILEIKLTEVMTLPLPESKEKTLSYRAFEKIEKFSQRCKAIALGPGISLHKESKELVTMIIKRLNIPLVLDADGINALVGEVSLLSKYKAPLIITPHPGEMSRLLKIRVEEVQKDRIKSAITLAKKTGTITVLKGARTIIADKEGNNWINSTGNPGMASAGSGDVLTGIIGGLLVQGIPPLEAAKFGVYFHGYAADLVIQEKEEMSLIASDILENLPGAIRRIKSEYY